MAKRKYRVYKWQAILDKNKMAIVLLGGACWDSRNWTNANPSGCKLNHIESYPCTSILNGIPSVYKWNGKYVEEYDAKY